MWDLQNKLSRGRLSLRRYTLLVSTIILACFATLGPLTQTAFAEDAVRQQGNEVTYQGKVFRFIDLNNDEKMDHIPPGLPANTNGYVNFTDPDKGPINLLLTEGHVNKATTAQYVSYEYKPINQFGKQIGKAETVTLTGEADGKGNMPGANNCDSAVTGAIGWIVCPVTTFLAVAMDKFYGFIQQFMVVKTVTNDTSSSIYRLWSMVRDLSNVCFVIAFLVIIYSQVTNLGIGNYGIKRTLPRIIIAAILVNASYWICAVGVDASNILGSSIYNLFSGIMQQLNTGAQYDNVNVPTWQGVTATILSGGAFAGAIIVNSASGAIFLLLAFLIGVIPAALLAFIVLAARQALITCLIIISPLAMVAYILPNTEKYFDKWKDSLLTLLLLFPIFSVIFSGSQLAGLAIIQNAGGSILTMLLGMAVQVAPVVITPMLIKFSGSVIGKIAGIVNNPSRGVFDRAANWSRGMAGERKNRAISGLRRDGTIKPRRRHTATRMAYRYTQGQTEKRKNYETAAALEYAKSDTAERHDTARRATERKKQGIDARHDTAWNERIQTNTAFKQLEVGTKHSEVKSALSKSQVDRMHAEIVAKGSESEHILHLRNNMKAEDYQGMLTVARGIKTDSVKTAFEESAKHMADQEFSEFKTDALKNNVIKVAGGNDIKEINGKSIRNYAAGIGDEANVFADAIAKSRRDFGEQANAQRELAAHFKVSSSQMAKLSMGKEDVTVTDDTGNTYTFSKDNEYVRDMAAEEIFTVGSHNDKMRVIQSTGASFDANGNIIPGTEGENYAYRRTVMQAAIKSGFSKAAPAINDKTLEDINNGRFQGESSWQYHSLREILEGRLNASSLSTANVNSLKMLFADPKHDTLARTQYDKLISDAVAAKLAENPQADPMATRTAIEQTFNARRDDLRRMASTVLSTPTIRQAASDESVGQLKSFAGEYYKGN